MLRASFHRAHLRTAFAALLLAAVAAGCDEGAGDRFTAPEADLSLHEGHPELILPDLPDPEIRDLPIQRSTVVTEDAGSEVIVDISGGVETVKITFEGLAHRSDVPTIAGAGFEGWIAGIDADEPGGSLNIANEPSPSTVIFWLATEGLPDDFREIVFDEPITSVTAFYASFPDVTFQAFDASGNLIDEVVGPGNWNQGPGGDPTGLFNLWEPLTVSATAANGIRKVRFVGAQNQAGLDDFTFTRAVTIVDLDVQPGSDPNTVNPASRGLLPVAVLTTADFDAADVDPATVTLGDRDGDDTPVATRRNGSLMASFEDVDADGDDDLVLHFDVQALVDNGDLTADSEELILRGLSTGGELLRGLDDVRIVGR